VVEQHERGAGLDGAVCERGRGKRQEAVRLVAAEHVEPNRLWGGRVQQHVDRAPELDATQAHGQSQELVPGKTPHRSGVVPA
jgi:hypothetical protein